MKVKDIHPAQVLAWDCWKMEELEGLKDLPFDTVVITDAFASSSIRLNRSPITSEWVWGTYKFHCFEEVEKKVDLWLPIDRVRGWVEDHMVSNEVCIDLITYNMPLPMLENYCKSLQKHFTEISVLLPTTPHIKLYLHPWVEVKEELVKGKYADVVEITAPEFSWEFLVKHIPYVCA
ncbi:MAG: hypothetical protein QXT86_13920 [Archaeoglobaceae archaeon]